MANYKAMTRTNYFRVKDEASFRELMGRVTASEDFVQLWEKNIGSQKFFAFGCHSYITGTYNPEDKEVEPPDVELFFEELQKQVIEDDAIIIFDIGCEKLRYLTAYATVITSYGIKGMNLENDAIQIARNLLKRPDYDTVCEF
jgi:hypothetical protein